MYSSCTLYFLGTQSLKLLLLLSFKMSPLVLLFTDGTVRLVNGNDRCSGTVEVHLSGQWGTVCDDDWDTNDASVVCRMLGCEGVKEAPGSARFGSGEGTIWLDNMQCSGSETSLLDCQHGGLGTHNCNHGEDAGVICYGSAHTHTHTHTHTHYSLINLFEKDNPERRCCLTAPGWCERMRVRSPAQSVWRLHVLPVSAGVSSGCSGFLTQSKDMLFRFPHKV
uniref:Soluble scavenger receptor cysteine-rich domain-containing protein SSC5D n=1 Tax=Scleropages formosus TaxID=113540 RepID=A0A8C9UXZ2_SCLFO